MPVQSQSAEAFILGKLLKKIDFHCPLTYLLIRKVQSHSLD